MPDELQRIQRDTEQLRKLAQRYKVARNDREARTISKEMARLAKTIRASTALWRKRHTYYVRRHMGLEQDIIREFGTATFSDRVVKNKGLGWAPVEDKRDWKLEERLSAGRSAGIKHWANPISLDQGSEGACVGFGTTSVINAEPYVHSFDNAFAFDLYKLAQSLDPWPGEDYSGTSVRAGAAAATKTGFFSAYAFTQSVQTLALYLLNNGPAMIGVDWHEGMDRVDPEGYIYPTGAVRGGHCVIIDGVVWGVRDEENRFRIRNSWGNSWGFNGRCRIKAVDLQYLFNHGGTACMPVEVD